MVISIRYPYRSTFLDPCCQYFGESHITIMFFDFGHWSQCSKGINGLEVIWSRHPSDHQSFPEERRRIAQSASAFEDWKTLVCERSLGALHAVESLRIWTRPCDLKTDAFRLLPLHFHAWMSILLRARHSCLAISSIWKGRGLHFCTKGFQLWQRQSIYTSRTLPGP